MRFHQRRFFAYPSGAPNLHTLNSESSFSHTLVTTDRCVSILDYKDGSYILQKIEMAGLQTGEEIVMASAAIERPTAGTSQVAVAYATEEKLYLQVLAIPDRALGSEETTKLIDCEKFELDLAPTCMFSVQATGPNGDVFYGVMMCCTDALMAFGYIENEEETESLAECFRLSNDQFAVYFPELATFSHTVLAVDVFTSPEKDQGWVAFGCADGLACVLHGLMHKGRLSGPYKSIDLHQIGPVTSIALFPRPITPTTETDGRTWQCNVLVTCAIGQAVVYEDIYSTSDQDQKSEMLMDSDSFDSILAGITADIDLASNRLQDGVAELILGTDNQVTLAYKRNADKDSSQDAVSDLSHEVAAVESNQTFTPTSFDSSHNIWSDTETENQETRLLEISLTRRQKWQRLPRPQWDLKTFGVIYSLLWRDINHDGVPELLVASSTGIYVYEADSDMVIDKLNRVLAALNSRRLLARHARFLSVPGTIGRSNVVGGGEIVDLFSDSKPGLFQLPNLHAPSDFPRLTQDVKLQCLQLRQELAVSTTGIQTLRALDDISNAICSVIDAAELCRNVHPIEDFRRAASKCFTELSDFIQNLNADKNLYKSIKSVTKNKEEMKSFSAEQRRMAILLRSEFERDGIHLSQRDRQRVIAVQNEITQLGMEFQSSISCAREFVEVPAKLLRGLPYSIASVCERKWMNPSVLRVPTDVYVTNTILKWVGDPKVRQNMYIAANTCTKDNLSVLDNLRAKRHELATLLDFPTYAHLATSDRMIGSPEAVQNFIENIAAQLMSKAKSERQLLLSAKRKHEGSSVDQIFMWDLPYYMGMLKAQTHRIDSHVLSTYFPLENCLKGLHLLCSSLFGLELKEIPMLNTSETWHKDVVKLALIRKNKTMGYIYFDLYPRPNKYAHAAHFTIRCGKRLSESSYQKPIVALVCNFAKPAPDSPSLLAHAEVETLFHEFGHAMHSLLSRTEFQHLSGTRATLDFVETPSHLLEYFVWDYRVVKEFAHHYKTGEPLPPSMMQGLRASKTMFAAMDTQTQCLYSMLDLRLFGEYPLPCNPPTTTQLLHELQNSSTLVPHLRDTYWHTRFGHLIGYGAGYYSYLYARVFAADIWYSIFAASNGPLNREAGENLYQKLMIHGGAKDPNELLTDMLGRQPSPANYIRELRID
ncbi:hypothetical protein CCR75_001239 [Bremia lactucae]|uniref:Peptidase M3A/M3B catalytic domain-containing protein n=1 Tax=Bremia lactucae TaxID=4779 RepID=A0A976IHX6_BRELC|nr:hypothetical protein CCR75_001239 [Bremia lactucae]